MGTFTIRKNEQAVQGIPTGKLQNLDSRVGKLEAGSISSLFFADGEIPAGTINGSNPTFTVSHTPTSGSLKLFFNGLRLTNTVDYTVSGSTITMTTIPYPGDILTTDYRY